MNKVFLDRDALLWTLLPDAPGAGQTRITPADAIFSTAEIIHEAADTLHRHQSSSWDQVDAFVASAQAHCQIQAVTPALYTEARNLARHYDLGLMPATLVATALAAGCQTLCTAQLPDGWTLDRLKVHNPFEPSPAPQAANQRAQQNQPTARLARLYQRPGFLLRRAHQIAVAIFENACNSMLLTPAQFAVLTVVNAHPGINQTLLAQAIGLDKVTVSHLLRSLEQRGLILRGYNCGNRRSLCLSLTATGLNLLDTAEPAVSLAYRQFLQPLAPTQQQTLMALLNQLNQQLEPLARAPFKPL